jgi:hypothetical protein
MRVNNSKISGMDKHVTGNNNTVSGMNAIVHGNNNIVSGMYGVVHGNNNTISGMNCKAYGKNNIVTGMGSSSEPLSKKIEILKKKERNDDVVMTFNNSVGSNINGRIIGTDDKRIISLYSSKKKKKTKEIKYVQGPTLKELEDDVKEEEGGDNTCVICLENKKICNISPCQHKCCCVKCARELCFGDDSDEEILKKRGEVKCPVCRKDVKSILKVFE